MSLKIQLKFHIKKLHFFKSMFSIFSSFSHIIFFCWKMLTIISKIFIKIELKFKIHNYFLFQYWPTFNFFVILFLKQYWTQKFINFTNNFTKLHELEHHFRVYEFFACEVHTGLLNLSFLNLFKTVAEYLLLNHYHIRKIVQKIL